MTAPTLALPAAPEVVADTSDLSREAWLALRREGIGGSDAAAIAGLDPWKSAFAVYLDKVGMAPEDNDSEPAYWGRELEPFVVRRFARDTGRHVVELPQLLRSREHPFALANIDRLSSPQPDLDIDAVVEAKTTNAWNADYADGDGMDGVPDRVAVQLQHYLGVTGYRLGYVAVLVGGQRFRMYEVQRDDDLIAHLWQIEGEFWQRVLDKVPPAPDAACKDLLAHLFDVKKDSVVELDAQRDQVVELTRRRQTAKEQMKALQVEADEAEAQLRALLGENEVGTLDALPVITWKQQQRKAYEVAAAEFRAFRVHPRFAARVLEGQQ